MLTSGMRTLAEILAETGIEALEVWRSGAVEVKQVSNTRRGETMDFSNKQEDRWDRLGAEKIRVRLGVERFLTEEGANDPERNAEGGCRGVMDWLDGSSNFATRQPDWAFSTAVEEDGYVKLGGIYSPARGELIIAGEGEGMYYLNTFGLTLDKIKDAIKYGMLEYATVIRFALPQSKKMTSPLEEERIYWHTGKRRNYELDPDDPWNTFPAKLANPGCVFCCTSAMVQVALGKLGGAAIAFQNYWDFAAGKLLIREAGGYFVAISRDYSHVLTAVDFAEAHATKTAEGDEWLCHIFAAHTPELLHAMVHHFGGQSLVNALSD